MAIRALILDPKGLPPLKSEDGIYFELNLNRSKDFPVHVDKLGEIEEWLKVMQMGHRVSTYIFYLNDKEHLPLFMMKWT